jgi:hypothetical protein
MNFTIGWILGLISLALAIIAALAWANAARSRRKETPTRK